MKSNIVTTENSPLYSVYKIYEDGRETKLIKKDITWLEAKHYVYGDNEDIEVYFNIIEQPI